MTTGTDDFRCPPKHGINNVLLLNITSIHNQPKIMVARHGIEPESKTNSLPYLHDCLLVLLSRGSCSLYKIRYMILYLNSLVCMKCPHLQVSERNTIFKLLHITKMNKKKCSKANSSKLYSARSSVNILL